MSSLRALFDVPSTSAPWDVVVLPALACFALALVAIELLPARSVRWRAAVVAALLILWLRYLLWRGLFTLNRDDAIAAALSIGVFGVECLVFVASAVNLVGMVPTSDRTPEADRLSQDVAAGRYVPSVDVFVATLNEPVAMLRRTVMGCQAIEYPSGAKRIYLLDDGRRDAVRAIAAELGCGYIARPDNRHFKAGNLNYALARTRGDLVASFDADFVPARDFLLRTVGFFQDARVALVQTPQTFYNPDPIARNLGLEDVLLEENAPFFLAAEPSRDPPNAVICHGTSFLARRAAIEAVGGFPVRTITEDMALSVRLAAAGWRLVNLDEPLSVGMAAEEIGSYVDQRLRWTRGNMQVFFSREANPLLLPGLTIAQRLLYVFGSFGFFSMCFARVAFLLLPLVYLYGGVAILRAGVAELLYYQLPYFVLAILAASWLRGGTRSPFWDDVYATVLCVPQCATVLHTLVRPFGTGFKVTRKGVDLRRLRWSARVGGPLVSLFVLLAGGLAWRLSTDRWAEADPGGLAVIYFFAVYNLVYLWLAILTTFDCPQERASVRLRERVPCVVRGARGAFEGTTIDISESGALIEKHGSGEIPPGAVLDIPAARLEGVPIARVRAASGRRLGVAFGSLATEQERRLVEFIFCRSGTWGTRRVDEARSGWAFVRSIFAIHPLAETR